MGKSLEWTMTVSNTSDGELVIGDWGVPLAFNEYWSDGDAIYETRVIDHSFVGKNSSYVYAQRPSGVGRLLCSHPTQTPAPALNIRITGWLPSAAAMKRAGARTKAAGPPG